MRSARQGPWRRRPRQKDEGRCAVKSPWEPRCVSLRSLHACVYFIRMRVGGRKGSVHTDLGHYRRKRAPRVEGCARSVVKAITPGRVVRDRGRRSRSALPAWVGSRAGVSGNHHLQRHAPIGACLDESRRPPHGCVVGPHSRAGGRRRADDRSARACAALVAIDHDAGAITSYRGDGAGANSGQGRVDWLCRVERPLWDQAVSAALHSSDIVAFRILSLPVLN